MSALPAKYFNIDMRQPAAAAGSCLLTPTAEMVRPRIGGSRRLKQRHRRPPTRHSKHRRSSRNRKQQKGGFLPSIGEPFAAAAAKYIAPLALYGVYRFLNPVKHQTRRRKH
jgi:hypothetical protein